MGTLITVPSRGTKKRPIRVEDELWEPYLQLCQEEGTTAAEDIREHMRRRLREAEARQGQSADDE